MSEGIEDRGEDVPAHKVVSSHPYDRDIGISLNRTRGRRLVTVATRLTNSLVNAVELGRLQIIDKNCLLP